MLSPANMFNILIIQNQQKHVKTYNKMSSQAAKHIGGRNCNSWSITLEALHIWKFNRDQIKISPSPATEIQVDKQKWKHNESVFLCRRTLQPQRLFGDLKHKFKKALEVSQSKQNVRGKKIIVVAACVVRQPPLEIKIYLTWLWKMF